MSLLTMAARHNTSCEICDCYFRPNSQVLGHAESNGDADTEFNHFFHPRCILEHLSFLPDPRCSICDLQITSINGVPVQRTLEAVKDAIDNFVGEEYDIETFIEFLSYGEITEEVRGESVIYATEENCYEAVQALLNGGSISNEDGEIAFLEATDNENDAIVSLLLNDEISGIVLGEALIRSAWNENLEISQLVIQHGHIPDEDMIIARAAAEVSGNQALISLFSMSDSQDR